MKKLVSALSATLAAAALLGASAPASAYGTGTPTTYSNLVWLTSFNAAGISNCTQLQIDATGDLQRSDALLVYGALNCSNGAYGVTGSLFTTTEGAFSITLMVAGYTVVCPRVLNFAGNCTVYDAGWVSRGSGRIELQ